MALSPHCACTGSFSSCSGNCDQFSASNGRFAVIAWPAAALSDRHRLTITLDYDLQGREIHRFNELVQAFQGLAKCRRVWRIPIQVRQTDWKRNAGTDHTVQRQRISPEMALPSLIKSNLQFAMIPIGKETIYFAPDAILIVARRSVAALQYDQLEISTRTTRFVENDGSPSDTTVVGETWQYVNKGGGPDRRFSNNRKLPVCLYGEMDLKSSSGLNERIQCSRAEAAAQFASSAVAMQPQRSSHAVEHPREDVSAIHLSPELQKVTECVEIRGDRNFTWPTRTAEPRPAS
jgi:hypothetical protein